MTNRLSLPRGIMDLTPDWLTAALRTAGVLQRGSVEAVDVEIIGEERGFTGVVARLRPLYAHLPPDVIAPPSLIAKLPTAERGAPSAYRAKHERDRAAGRAHFERCAREVAFYRDIAAISSLPVPRMYFGSADDTTGRVMMLLEDFSEADAGDALDGCTLGQAALVVQAIAPLHAHWWRDTGWERLDWLPRWSGDHRSRQDRLSRQVDPFLMRYGHQLPTAVIDIVNRLRGCYARVLAALDQVPATVIHADLHLDNVLFQRPGVSPPAVVLDWQSVAHGPAAVDVALFLCGSLDPLRRREADVTMLRLYHELLVAYGVRHYAAEQLHDDYRRALLWQLAGTIGWLSSVNQDDVAGRERALVEAAIGDGRLIAALLDNDVVSLLPA